LLARPIPALLISVNPSLVPAFVPVSLNRSLNSPSGCWMWLFAQAYSRFASSK